MNGEDFPQADELGKVFHAVNAVAAGYTDDKSIEIAIGLDSGGRQGRYYRKAGVALGFMTNSQNEAHLTAAGLKLASATSAEERIEALRNGVLACEPLAALYSQVGDDWTSKATLRDFYASIYPGAASTPERRSSTAFNYLTAVGLVESAKTALRRIDIAPAESGNPSNPEAPGLTSQAPVAAEEPELSEPQSPFITMEIDRQKMERANSIHESLVTMKKNELSSRGIAAESTPLIDLMATFGGQNVIYEMKSTNEDASNLLAQVRKAVSQLHEYRFLANLDATLCLVTNAPIPQTLEWLKQYLTLDRGIAYVWIDESGHSHNDIGADGILSEWM